MDSEPKLITLISQLNSLKDITNLDPGLYSSELMSVTSKLISLVKSMDSELNQPETELMSLTSQTVACFKSIDLDSQPDPLRKLITIIAKVDPQPELKSLVDETLRLEPLPELILLIQKVMTHVDSVYTDPELKLKLLFTQLIFLDDLVDSKWNYVPTFVSHSIEIISLVSSVDSWDSKQQPESELMSLVKESISVFKSMDFDSQPEPLRKLISLASRRCSFVNFIKDSDSKLDSEFFDLVDEDSSNKLKDGCLSITEKQDLFLNLHSKLFLLVGETMSLEPEPKLISLVYQILSLVMSMNSKWKSLISFCPQVQVMLNDGKFHVKEEEQGSWSRNDKWDFLDVYPPGVRECVKRWRNSKWDCLPLNWEKAWLHGEDEDATHFFCRGCYGENHKENSKAPIEIKHPLHPKHSLQLVFWKDGQGRLCYCCGEDIGSMLYYCSACDIVIRFSCAGEPRVLFIELLKWHEHTLVLFPSQAPLTCSLCALTRPDCPFYICPPCDFVVHQNCLTLPHVVKISRHPHRISFTHSFQNGDWSCGICRRKINNDYGGYHCIKSDCLYVAHSNCATQRNVWDGIDLGGEPEEEEVEEAEPFVMISDGVIQHFAHEDHHLRLDENTCRDYDENKFCHACSTPIYFGNFYTCLQCDFLLHQVCANLPRRIHHPVHPHLLDLETHKPVTDSGKCSACPSMFAAGFFYECRERQCRFRLHLPCATISEPLVHTSHVHPLFLTSKPDEERICSICRQYGSTNETFNCIEEECDFALCFSCATLPQKVRYKHDKHILSLSYGKETSTMTYWCEACEGKISPSKGFYMCDEYCCVHLHIKCMLGRDLYVKPGSSWSLLRVMPNNSMSRPVCYLCNNRCPHKIVFQLPDFVFCSWDCYQVCSWSMKD